MCFYYHQGASYMVKFIWIKYFTLLLQDYTGDYMFVDFYLTLFANEKRFGFSVMGGLDEGFAPRINDITVGKYITEIF